MPSLTGSLGPHSVHRIGFGAMQLPGPRVFGPPRDHAKAVAVVRRARELGVDHIDTAGFYGPDVANEVLAEALSPWPDSLRIVSKVGARRDDAGGWLPALTPQDIRAAVESDLRVLGIDRLTAVNLRILDTADDVFDAAPRPADHPEVQRVAAELDATPSQVALAWLLHHAEHVLLIPGTSSPAHLEENLGAADVALSAEHLSLLDGLAAAA